MSAISTSRAPALPALGGAIDTAAATLRRFPTVLIAAAICTAAAIVSVEEIGPDWIGLRLLATASLGIPLFIAVTFVGEQARARHDKVILQLLALGVLATYFAGWPGWTPTVRALRYVQLGAAFHLLVAVMPFARTGRQNAFWQFNRALLIRFIIAGVSSGTLWGGLALALAALHKLFGVDVPPTAYARLWFVFAFLFTTWFFLADVPRDVLALEERRDYPIVLRVFAQYILTPLVALYLVILTLYLAKVVVTWTWPSGWIGLLVSGVAAAGILALLLVQPIAAEPDQKWIATFTRDFWLAIVPAVVMVWLAIWQRVQQYGITEPRYFLVVLSLWLAAMAAYFRLRRAPRITMIPASLCAVAVLSLAGPWGAYDVARASQTSRLTGLLHRTGVMAGNRVDPMRGRAVSGDDAREITATIRYLVENHGVRSLAWMLPDTLTRRLARLDEPGEGAVRTIARTIGVAYVERGASGLRAGEHYTVNAEVTTASVAIAGYDALVPVRRPADSSIARDTGFTARLEDGLDVVRVRHRGQVLVDVPLDSMVARARRSRGERRWAAVPQALLRVEAVSPGARATLVVRSLDATALPGRLRVTSLDGYVLVRVTKR